MMKLAAVKISTRVLLFIHASTNVLSKFLYFSSLQDVTVGVNKYLHFEEEKGKKKIAAVRCKLMRNFPSLIFISDAWNAILCWLNRHFNPRGFLGLLIVLFYNLNVFLIDFSLCALTTDFHTTSIKLFHRCEHD